MLAYGFPGVELLTRPPKHQRKIYQKETLFINGKVLGQTGVRSKNSLSIGKMTKKIQDLREWFFFGTLSRIAGRGGGELSVAFERYKIIEEEHPTDLTPTPPGGLAGGVARMMRVAMTNHRQLVWHCMGCPGGQSLPQGQASREFGVCGNR